MTHEAIAQTEKHQTRPLTELYHEFAINPQGGDPDIGLYSAAMRDMMAADPTIEQKIRTIQEMREAENHPLTDKQAVTLTQRALQILLIEKGFYDSLQEHLWDTPYPRILGLDTQEAWAEFITTTTTEHADRYHEILLKYDNATNVPQRAAGPHWLVREFFGDDPVTILDLGSSPTMGVLAQFATNRDLNPIEYNDFPDNGAQISSKLALPINLQHGYGLDLAHHRLDPTVLLGFRYPSESTRNRIEADRQRMVDDQKLPNLHYIQGNMLDLPLRNDFVDVSMSTTSMYQLPNGKKLEAIDQALQCSDLMFIQDFMIPDENEVLHTCSLSGKNAYGLFVIHRDNPRKALEAIRFGTGRCTDCSPGKDYQEVMRMAEQYRQNRQRFHT